MNRSQPENISLRTKATNIYTMPDMDGIDMIQDLRSLYTMKTEKLKDTMFITLQCYSDMIITARSTFMMFWT